MNLGVVYGSRIRQNHQSEPTCDVHTGSATVNQTGLACLTTYAPSTVLLSGYVYGQLGALGQKVQALEEQSHRLRVMVEEHHRRHEEYLSIVAACQRDTAAVLNHELDRHALHPAIEAVVALAEELSHLKECASRVPDANGDGAGVDRLRGEIDISWSIAREKLAHLDVRTIAPAPGEGLDPKLHAVCGYTVTTDEHLHGRIGQVVTPGITYRGKVLQQARVLVFRTKTSANQQ